MITDTLARAIQDDFLQMMDKWHSLPEVFDNDLDREIAKWNSEVKDVFPKYPYFSPSSVGGCPQALYFKYWKAQRDNFGQEPYQGRWQRAGTATGDWLQRDLVFITRHFEKVVGEEPRFKLAFTEDGYPCYEGFVKKSKAVKANGEEFYLHGAPDGILVYTTDSGEEIKVGIEIKSKQTTAARTSLWSMRDAEEGHKQQAALYSEMYDVDYYMIVYYNLSKKGWVYTEEDYEKSPDLRAFAYHVDEDYLNNLLQYLGTLITMFRTKNKPKLSIDGWTFNGYKTEAIRNMTEDELEEIEEEVQKVLDDPSAPKFKKYGHQEVLEEIKETYNFYQKIKTNSRKDK